MSQVGAKLVCFIVQQFAWYYVLVFNNDALLSVSLLDYEAAGAHGPIVYSHLR